MNKVLASEAGYLGTNVDSNFDLAWLKTEVIDKLENGDKTAALKLLNQARHSEDEKVAEYAKNTLELHAELLENYEEI